MSLIGNYRVINKTNGRWVAGPEAGVRSNWNKPTFSQAPFLSDQNLGHLPIAAKYLGYLHPYSTRLPLKDGGIAAFNRAQGSGDITNANLAGGRNAESTISGTGDITNAAMGLILSAVATIAGSSTVTADVIGKLEAVASIAGSGDITAALGALASLVASVTAEGSIDANITAEANISANINVTGDLLTTANVAQAVWNALAASFNEAGTMGALLNASGGSVTPEIIADVILRRSTANVEASANGDPIAIKSLYGMIAQAVHNTQVAGTTLTVTRSDDSTVLGTRTVTTNAAAEPIVGIDTD